MTKKHKSIKEEKRENELDVSKLSLKGGKYILPLLDIVKYGSDEIDHLEMSTPKAKHIRDMSSDPTMDDILIVIESLADQPTSMIDELSMRDALRAMDFFNHFN